MLQIEFTPEAVEDLRLLRKYDQNIVVSEIEAQLQYDANRETRNRKRLRPNQLAEWEMRVGLFRVFYDVDSAQTVVRIVGVGEKRGSKLFIHGEEYQL